MFISPKPCSSSSYAMCGRQEGNAKYCSCVNGSSVLTYHIDSLDNCHENELQHKNTVQQSKFLQVLVIPPQLNKQRLACQDEERHEDDNQHTNLQTASPEPSGNSSCMISLRIVTKHCVHCFIAAAALALYNVQKCIVKISHDINKCMFHAEA